MGRLGRRSRAAIALWAAIATAWPATLASAAGTWPAAPVVSAAAAGPGSADIAAAVAFREKLGFRADRAFVASTFASAAFADQSWGVPLDRAEAVEVNRRAATQRAAAKAFTAWATAAESAGAYIDLRGGGVPVFLTTGDPARARRAVGDLLPGGAAGTNARFLRVANAMDDLVALQARIDADMRAGTLAPLGVTSTAIDARANSVSVGVVAAEDAAADLDASRDALVARYGSALVVVAEAPAQGGDACTSRKSCPPAKGGVEIVSNYNGANCTTAFLAHVVGSGDPRILTAGHCIGKSGGTGTSRRWSQGGNDLGWAELTTWTDGADADVGLLNPVSGAVAGDRNLVFRSSKDDIAAISGWQANAAQLQGGLVCRSAAVSGYHCGVIKLTNRTKEIDGRTIDHQWVVDFDACPGDSGAPYVLGTIAYGIHGDSSWGCEPSTNEAWYSPIGWALSVLAAKGHPVELCTTSTCGSGTNAWTQRGSLSGDVWSPRLVSLDDDRVLAVSGLRRDPLAADAEASGMVLPEVFDPATGTWSETAAPPWAPAACEGQFAVRLGDGRVLVGGGADAGGGPDGCAGAYLYDPGAPAQEAWSSAADPPVPMFAAGTVLLEDGRAFVTGGTGADGSTSVALAYAPVTDEWSTLASAPSGSIAPLVLRMADGRVLVSGGRVLADVEAEGYADVAGTYLYDPGTNAWATMSAVGRDGAAGVVLADGRVVVAGGQHLSWSDGTQHAEVLRTVSILQPSTGAWTTLPQLRTARSDLTLAELPNGLLLAAGGRVGGATAAGAPSRLAEAYDWTTKAWYVAPSLGVSRAEQGSAVLADGTVLVAGGGTETSETYIAGDVLPPTASTPSLALRSGAGISAGIPVRVAFSASDRGGAGAGTFDVARSTDGGAWTTIATKVTTLALDTTVSAGHVHRFQVRARDWAGNIGPWKAGAAFRAGLVQQTAGSIAYSGTWSNQTLSSFSAGSARFARAAGAKATYTFNGRGIAFVTTKGTRGSARIYVDGSLVATVNLQSSSPWYRFVAFQRTWATAGSHRIAVVVVGTYGHPRVDVDAFVVLSNP